MIRLIFWLGLAAGLATSTHAQERALDRYGLPIPRHGLQLSAAHWFDPTVPGPHLSYLRALPNERQYLRLELGYLLDLGYQEALDIKNLRGVRGRVGWRKYRRPLSMRGSVGFGELGLSYRYLDLSIAGDFWDPSFQFQQRYIYRLRDHEIALSYLRGVSLYLSPNWRIELGIGLGVGLRFPRYTGVPEGYFFETNGYFLWRYDQYADPTLGVSVPILVHFGYYW